MDIIQIHSTSSAYSERNWFLMKSPSLSSPTDEKTETSSPNEFNPLAICAAAPGDSDLLFKFDAEFLNTAEHLGIKLAPRDMTLRNPLDLPLLVSCLECPMIQCLGLGPFLKKNAFACFITFTS